MASTIRRLVEARGAKLRGSAREGVRVALEVLDECRCETCAHFRQDSCWANSDTEEDFCSRWETQND
jgi:hypothetical protein